jgi:hypothetical protein
LEMPQNTNTTSNSPKNTRAIQFSSNFRNQASIKRNPQNAGLYKGGAPARPGGGISTGRLNRGM